MGISVSMVEMMEAASSSETSVNFYGTARCNIPEDSHLHTVFLLHTCTEYCLSYLFIVYLTTLSVSQTI
jgi:hypothetical protein